MKKLSPPPPLFGILLLVFALIILEFSFRTFGYLKFSIPPFRQNLHILRYYPELAPFVSGEIQTVDTSSNRILILGGSVVTSSLCDLENKLSSENIGSKKPLKIYSLARYAHNSMDSRNKIHLLSDYRFNYVFFYHAINDTRANNCPDDLFDKYYRHIEFYREIDLLNSHPEINWYVSPYYIHWIFDKMLITTGYVKLIPREYFVAHPKLMYEGLKSYPAPKNEEEKRLYDQLKIYHEKVISPDLKPAKQDWIEKGGRIKSADVFQKNLEFVFKYCKQTGAKLILSPFAAYLPENYSLHLFLTDSLDYAEQRWPAELYGKPENVMKGIGVHNQIIIKFASENPDVLFFNFPDSIGRGKKYFNDICHLTPEGCEVLSNCLSSQIIKSCQKQ